MTSRNDTNRFYHRTLRFLLSGSFATAFCTAASCAAAGTSADAPSAAFFVPPGTYDGPTKPDSLDTYIKRIEAVNHQGPVLNAVIALDPDAAALSASHGPLAGHPVLVKDNIETRDLPTTAGSLALADNATRRDAPLVANLRRAGAVVFGKTNLSEWANYRGNHSISGWSATGGQTRNPHAIDRSPCGSSSGSAAAVAAGLAWATVGTETDGSITCPASMNGIVGFKPTVGVVSRTHVVPISASQDTAGPMARTVADAALLLNAMAGADKADPATLQAPWLHGGAGRHPDFTAGLTTASLKGVRIGVLVDQQGSLPALTAVFHTALEDMQRAGAVLVTIHDKPDARLGGDEGTVLAYEFHKGIDAYLKSVPGPLPARDLAGLIAFDKAHAATEMRWFGQEIFEQALKTNDKAAYETARAQALHLSREAGIDALMRAHDVAVLVAPTVGPAPPIDPVNGDQFLDIGAGSLAAVAGYPHLTVPMGDVDGLPVGLSFIASRWQDARVLRLGAAYERARTATLMPAALAPWKAPAPQTR